MIFFNLVLPLPKDDKKIAPIANEIPINLFVVKSSFKNKNPIIIGIIIDILLAIVLAVIPMF